MIKGFTEEDIRRVKEFAYEQDADMDDCVGFLDEESYIWIINPWFLPWGENGKYELNDEEIVERYGESNIIHFVNECLKKIA